MKVAIDYRLALKDKAGIGNVISNLVNEYKKMSLDIELIEPDQVTGLNTRKRLQWDQITVPRKAKQCKANILHQPGLSAPVFSRITTIQSIYHFLPKALHKKPEFNLGFVADAYFNKWMPFTAKFCAHCITCSDFSRKTLEEDYGIAPEKISVIPLAPHKLYTKIKLEEKNHGKRLIEERFGVHGDYLLCVGTMLPYKNFSLLAAVLEDLVKVVPSVKLVIAGGHTLHTPAIMQEFSKRGVLDCVIFTGHISDQELHYLYVNASLLLMPSLFEGFGMPPLEAMQCGIPVISSNSASLPEVVGDGGILLSPYNKEAWTKSIIDVLGSSALRNQLVDKGFKQVSNYSWEKAAKATYSVYEYVHSRANR